MADRTDLLRLPRARSESGHRSPVSGAASYDAIFARFKFHFFARLGEHLAATAVRIPYPTRESATNFKVSARSFATTRSVVSTLYIYVRVHNSSTYLRDSAAGI